jgi:ferredoxin
VILFSFFFNFFCATDAPDVFESKDDIAVHGDDGRMPPSRLFFISRERIKLRFQFLLLFHRRRRNIGSHHIDEEKQESSFRSVYRCGVECLQWRHVMPENQVWWANAPVDFLNYFVVRFVKYVAWPKQWSSVLLVFLLVALSFVPIVL